MLKMPAPRQPSVDALLAILAFAASVAMTCRNIVAVQPRESGRDGSVR